MLKIENFSREYPGGKLAVDQLSLHIRPGDIYGFIGHNGAGKTTTLKACAGVLSPTKGQIYIDGLSMQSDPVGCKQRLAFIPDNPDLYGYLTGWQYLSFIADVFKLPQAQRTQRSLELAERLELRDALPDLIGSYSHGMAQKLALVAAFMHEPKLLLLDEPFVGLDPKASFELKTMFGELCERGGAIFFSTHVLDVAEKLCTKIAIIQGGRLVASGDTQTVRGDRSLEQTFMGLVDHG